MSFKVGKSTNLLEYYKLTDTLSYMKTKKIKNFKMNDNTYSLKRKVIDLIYEAKRGGVNLPRIEVRVGE